MRSAVAERGGRAAPLWFAALALVIHLPVVARYGWFRDELYCVACSKHPAWG